MAKISNRNSPALRVQQGVRSQPVTDRVIIELKAERQHHARLTHILAHFPVRADRHSKYVQGMIAAPDFDGIELL